MKGVRFAPGVVAILLGVACGDDTPAPEVPATPVVEKPEAVREGPPVASLSAQARREASVTMMAWLECEECRDGELEAVLALGRSVAVPTFARTLREGPSPARRSALDAALRQRWKALRSYADANRDTDFSVSEAAFVEIGVENATARYQMRSAVALARLGGPEAAKSLEQASGADLRPDVQRRVDSALTRVEAAETAP